MLSCSKSIEVKPPIDRLTTVTVFSDDATAGAAILGLYSQMFITAPLISCGGVSLYTGLAADELMPTASSSDERPFYENAISPASSPLLTFLWQRGYKLIYNANAIIEGIDQSKGMSTAASNQLKGEAKVLRAFIYFNLVNLFGDVPLVTVTDYHENAVMPRRDVSEIYAQIMKDLEEGKDLLAGAYQGAGRVRINKWTAVALLSRVCLYRQQWSRAEQLASEVINSGMYSMASSPRQVFLAASPEILWQLGTNITGFNTAEGFLFIPTGATVLPSYVLSDDLLSGFEIGDKRKEEWLGTNLVAGKSYTYPFKYKVRFGMAVTEVYSMLRLAEQYLIRSEARARLNNVNGSKEDINLVRQRSGLSAITAPDAASVLSFIDKERRIEFFAEWGHRWMDLKRLGRMQAVLGSKPGWSVTDSVFPLPQQELLLNPFLKQNEGY